MEIRIYRVGGAVRDAIMGRRSKDIDFSVEAESYEAMRAYIESRIEAHGGRIFQERPEFVTIRAMIGHEAADFVLARRDGSYSDGRRPDQVFAGTIFDDLARRDFTMNAIAIDEDGNYIDPFNGIADIEAGIIRCVGSAQDRMREDYLRLARAARFSITKGMSIDSEIEEMFDNEQICSAFERSISQERIRDEINKMFAFDTQATFEFFAAHPRFFRACIGSMHLIATSANV